MSEYNGAILDPALYSQRKPAVRLHIDNHPEFELNYGAGLIATDTFLHIVIVTFFIGEALGFTDAIVAKLRRDMSYHHVDKVIGLDEAIAAYKASLVQKN